MEFKMKIHAATVTKKAVQKLIEGAEFHDDASEDYKDGFYDFGSIIVAILEEMEGDKE